MKNRSDGEVASADGTLIGWTRHGDGPPIVMVSSVMACRQRTPQPGLPLALAARFSVYTYDRRGTGDSDEGQSDYAVEREFEDLAAILELAGPGAVVYGFSSGATLALLAAAHGLPIARLVLNEPPLMPDPELSHREEARRRLVKDPADARRWFDEEVTGIPPEIRAQFPPPTPLDLANASAMLHELTFLPGTSPERFTDVRTPTLLIASDHTAPDLLRMTRELGQALPNAAVRVIPGQWHHLADEDVVAAIGAFVAGNDTQEPTKPKRSARMLPKDHVAAYPDVIEREAWQQQIDELRVREKAHTRAGDALAAERRRLPMVKVPADATVVGPSGEVPILDVFEGRRMLLAYFHMWHDGLPWAQQCEGCTFSASQMQRPEYLHARDITLAVFCEGDYAESSPYAQFLDYVTPWYSARSSTSLTAGREFGFHACYVRDDHGQVYETYWTTDRGAEAGLWSYGLMDMTVFGRQERWEDSPPGWPRLPDGQHQWRIDGRPIAQWPFTNEPAEAGAQSHCH